MISEFKNILLAGIGSAASTYEKASNLIEHMVEKGNITVNEGKELSQELKKTIDDSKKNKNLSSEENQLTKEDVISIFNELNLVKKDDLNDINDRIKSLEHKVSQLGK